MELGLTTRIVTHLFTGRGKSDKGFMFVLNRTTVLEDDPRLLTQSMMTQNTEKRCENKSNVESKG